jgi:hypothetical protein
MVQAESQDPVHWLGSGAWSYKIFICPQDKLSALPHMGVPCELDLAYAAPFSPGTQVLSLRMLAYQR